MAKKKNKGDEMFKAVEDMVKESFPDVANDIMGGLTSALTASIDGYAKGQKMSLKEFRKLKVNDIVWYCFQRSKDEKGHLRLDEAMRVTEIHSKNEIVVTEGYADYEVKVIPGEDEDFAETEDDGSGYAFLHKAIFITKEVEQELERLKVFTKALRSELDRGAGLFYEFNAEEDEEDE